MKSFKVKILIAIVAVALITGTSIFAARLGVGQVSQPSIAASLVENGTVASIFNNASPAVVEINVTEQTSGFFLQGTEQGQGSGFLIDNQGDIITNNHVVDGATSVTVTFSTGKTATASIVGTDAKDDLALIKVAASDVSGITPLQLGDSSSIQIGQMAVAIGSPYGLQNTVTVGVISGINRSFTDNSGNMTGMLQTDAALNPGNSGGPLLNSNGQVIGVNTAIEQTSTGANGLGFAIPSNTVSNVLNSLEAGNKITRPYLGIEGTDLNATLAKSLGLNVSSGVYVVQVMSGSPAASAGLVAGGIDNNGNPTTGGDVITAVDGNTVTSVTELSSDINSKQVGDTVTLTVIRNGQTVSVNATLAEWPSQLSSSGTVPQTPQFNVPTPQQTIPWPFSNGNGRRNQYGG